MFIPTVLYTNNNIQTHIPNNNVVFQEALYMQDLNKLIQISFGKSYAANQFAYMYINKNDLLVSNQSIICKKHDKSNTVLHILKCKIKQSEIIQSELINSHTTYWSNTCMNNFYAKMMSGIVQQY